MKLNALTYRLTTALAVIAAATLQAGMATAQNTAMTLDLGRAIELASDSSLSAFRYQNMYMSGYWEYRSYRADRLPSLTMNLNPATYYRNITQQYNYDEGIYVYRAQQYYAAGAGLSIVQNFDPLGGTFYIDTDLDYIRNFGDVTSNQFTSVPIRVGYRQSLLGYNQFKWDRKIEPLKFERVKKEFLQNMQSVSEDVVSYFFDLALAQEEYRMAVDNLASCDTLYTLGERRFKIAAISQADLLTLKLEKVNAQNTLENSRIALKRAMFSLASYLGLDKNTSITVKLPAYPGSKTIDPSVALVQAKANNPSLLTDRQKVLEAQRDVNKTVVESRFNANINASIGFNQAANNFKDVYRHPLRQDLVSVSMSIPLIDWGVRKGKVNVAKNNLSVVEIAARQNELSIEEDVVMTVSDFNIQQQLISSAREALDLADMAYAQTKKRFMIGKTDLNSLTLSLNRQTEANKNYITSLKNYWLSYYKLRKLTLYDFEMNRILEIE